MEAIVDLREKREVRRVGVDCLRAQGPWIFLPRWVEVAVSTDGDEWITAGRVEVPLENNPVMTVERIEVEVPRGLSEGGLRFVRVVARNRGVLPEWHPGASERGWLFVDEIVVLGG